MSRSKHENAALAARARELAAGGRSVREVTAMLVAEGHKVGKTSVAVWLVQPAAPPTRPRRERAAPAPEVAPAVEPVPTAAATDEPEDVADRLRRSLTLLERAAAAAEDEGDTGRLISAARAAIQAASALARLTPPAPPDPEAHPDMQEAARRAREKLLAMVVEAVRRAA